MKRERISVYLAVLGILVYLGLNHMPTAASPPSEAMRQAHALVAEVNSRRAASGLPAYNINSALMASAQAHSDYQASIGTVTHSGAGGSRPMDRAMAAGYGGGSKVYVTENIYGGMNTSVSQAVAWWIGDGGWHYEGVMSTTYVDIGAGVVSSGGTVYYTLDVGWIASGVAPDAGGSAANNAQAAIVTKAAAVKPFLLATAASDGSVIHLVEKGQTLWTIAAQYNISLTDLLALNNLTQNSFVFPGNKIIVRPSSTPGAPAPDTPAAGTSAGGTSAGGAPAGLEESTPVPVTETPTPMAALDMLSTPINISAVTPEASTRSGIDAWRGIAALFIGIVALAAVLVLSLVKKEEE